MLTLVTGQPGNGKTLFTLVTVEAQRLQENRPVYQNGISGLTLPWHPLEKPEDWEKCPDGSIIVIDEAWRSDPRAFGLRGTTKAPPPYVENLATHRHHGFDIYLVTQSASQIDPFVRALVGRHFHLDRKFGLKTPTLRQWERIGDPKSAADKREAQSKGWTFPEESFKWYSSAVIHTHKRSLPWRKLGVLIAALLVLGGSLWWFFHNWHKSADETKKRFDKNSPTASNSDWVDGKTGLPAEAGASYWGVARQERVHGLAESAPLYDTLQKVKTQPRVDGCMSIAKGYAVECTCTAPGGGHLEVTVNQCLNYIRKGWFDETQTYSDVKRENIDYLNSQSKSSPSGDATPVGSTGTASTAAGATAK